MKRKTDKLLELAEPWLQYAVRRNLLGEDSRTLEGLMGEALKDPKIRAWLKDVEDFHGTIVSSHKDPDLPIHKLLLLLDLGLDGSVPEIGKAQREILKHRDIHGVPLSRINIPVRYGGSGRDTFGWSPCDAPLLLEALLLGGADYERDVKPGLQHLLSLCLPAGMPCSSSPELGSFRGPGRKADPCPYASLILLRLLSLTEDQRDGPAAEAMGQLLLRLWEDSHGSHPYMFFAGRDFRKLKAPSLWYDLTAVAEVLSRFPRFHDQPALQEMVALIALKADPDGLFTPESVYLKCRDWDFGQKKHPSLYLSYLCRRILMRMGRSVI